MDEFYDDDLGEETWKKKQGKKKKLLTNPKGAYQIDMTFRGIEYDIIIENTAFNKFKVCAICKDDSETDIEKCELELKLLNRYLEAEGFYLAAKKWNLFYE